MSASGKMITRTAPPGRSITGLSHARNHSSSLVSVPQVQSNQNLERLKLDSVRSIQPAKLEKNELEFSNFEQMISSTSERSRKLTRASEVANQRVRDSNNTVMSQSERAKRPSDASANKLDPAFDITSSGRSIYNTLSKKALSNRLEDSIRILADKLSSSGMMESDEESVDLQTKLKLCPCPNVKTEYHNEGEDEGEQVQSFCDLKVKRQPQKYKRKIKNVTRSPFERKDRAARQEFLNELQKMEIHEIEKKQILKPRQIKKFEKKEGVYQIIKDANLIPDSHTDTSPRHSATWSVATHGDDDWAPSIPSLQELSPEDSEESDQIDKLQLKGHHSIGSRAAELPLQREEAFLEIELSESDDAEVTPRNTLSSCSSSATELLSSSSEISLRVNVESTHQVPDRKKMKERNYPFVSFTNKLNKGMEGAYENSIPESTQEHLLIENIATEFGEWAKDNGLKPEVVEKDIIRELFQFGTMDTAANSIAVEIKELIIVPETITKGMHPDLEERATYYRQILWDEMAYWKKERSMAFGKADPFPYKRPANQPLPLWTKSGFVPLPLSTGELLYQSLIDNNSLMLERFILWMVENPKYHRPPYLIKSGYFQKIVDKYGGREDVIRKKVSASKHLMTSTGKGLAGLNIGMKTELKKLREMAKGDNKSPPQKATKRNNY